MKKILCFIMSLVILFSFSACGKKSKESFEKILIAEKWKVYSSGNEVTYEFNEDGTGQYSYGGYKPNEFQWEINGDELSMILDSGTIYYFIRNDNNTYQLERKEEKPLYVNDDYILVRQKDFEKMYDFEDRLISKAEFDVFLIYNSNFSHGNQIEIFVTNVENYGEIYTISGKVEYANELYQHFIGDFELQYRVDGENIKEIDNYFSRPIQK
ncbi:MAG: hypothetical protein E7406_09125 [Ruminococcaceae bacterium]|nr:hypothetical protein [Oscillospiraceae bacterium]